MPAFGALGIRGVICFHLTAMLDMASDKTSTMMFPLPINLFAGLRDSRLGELDRRCGKRQSVRLT